MLINLKCTSPLTPHNVLMTAAEVLSWQVNLCLIGFPSMALRCVWNKKLATQIRESVNMIAD